MKRQLSMNIYISSKCNDFYKVQLIGRSSESDGNQTQLVHGFELITVAQFNFFFENFGD